MPTPIIAWPRFASSFSIPWSPREIARTSVASAQWAISHRHFRYRTLSDKVDEILAAKGAITILSLRQSVLPAYLLGRVTAVCVVSRGVGSFGAPPGGVFAEWAGLRPTMIVAASETLLALI